jgi:hypothetical protein
MKLTQSHNIGLGLSPGAWDCEKGVPVAQRDNRRATVRLSNFCDPHCYPHLWRLEGKLASSLAEIERNCFVDLGSARPRVLAEIQSLQGRTDTLVLDKIVDQRWQLVSTGG